MCNELGSRSFKGKWQDIPLQLFLLPATYTTELRNVLHDVRESFPSVFFPTPLQLGGIPLSGWQEWIWWMNISSVGLLLLFIPESGAIEIRHNYPLKESTFPQSTDLSQERAQTFTFMFTFPPSPSFLSALCFL